MLRSLLLLLCMLLIAFSMATAGVKESGGKKTVSAAGEASAKQTVESAAKELSGMSIVGNDEAPKSLYIVPWKKSEIGGEASLNMMLNERAAPVDRDVFMRQLNFYEISTKK